MDLLSLHSNYVRQITDLPWHGVSIKIQLETRKFRCRNELCHRRVFCERLPKVVESYGRKTVRLQELFGVLAFVLGGEAGAKTAREMGLQISGDTLWSNGQVEGQVNRLKNIKRQIYGRGNFDLLKARVIHQF